MAELLKRLQEAGSINDKVLLEEPANEAAPKKFEVTDEVAEEIASDLGITFDEISKSEFMEGLNVEQEHTDVTKGNKEMTGKIGKSVV